MKEKSIKINMILNGIKGLLSVIFPLITFPYVSKILEAVGLGKYNFANSIITYFLLIAELGINTYAIREGARVRNDKEKLNKFANEIFSINVISTVISYLLLIITVIMVPKFKEYYMLLFILSWQIIFKTIGIEWIYSIYEDYKYITIRSIIFQVLSLILLFVFVRSKEDLYIYAITAVIATAGSNIINFIYARKYLKISFIKNMNFKQHIKPILVLFSTIIAITIYVNSDITILGFLTNDYTVGIYSLSTKVYTVIKNLLAAVVVVAIPRFSALIAQNDMKKFKTMAEDIYKTLIIIIIPAVVGMVVLSEEIILIVSTPRYLDARLSLAILSVAMYFCLGAGFWGQAMLLPLKQEKKVLKITIVSAIINLVLNFVFIPFWKESAAALTTLIAEMISFIYCKYETKKFVKLDSFRKIFIKSAIGSISIIIIAFIAKKYFENFIIYSIVVVLGSVISYTITQIILKNEIVLYYLSKVKNKILKKCVKEA